MRPFYLPWLEGVDSPLLKLYCRSKRFSLGKAQEVVAVYMGSDQASVAQAENDEQRWSPGPVWNLRHAIALSLLEINVKEDDALQFLHSMNKYWVAAENEGVWVHDPYDATYDDLVAEVYDDIAKTRAREDYQRYEAACQRMRLNRGMRERV